MVRPVGVVLSSLALAVACVPSATPSLGVSARLGALSAPAAGAGEVEVAPGLRLARVRVVLLKLELEREHSDVGEVEVGPLLVDLSGEALAGATVRLVELPAVEGTYDELELKVGPVPAAAGVTGGLAELQARGASVVLEGTVDGAPFTFTSALRLERERAVRFTLSPDAAGNVTFALDAGAWFVGPAGARLDPRDAAARAAIEENLRRAFDVFGDRDGDGDEDWDDDSDGGHRDGGDDDDSDGGSDGGSDDDDCDSSGPGSGDCDDDDDSDGGVSDGGVR